jgi:uroporphyrinogen decarboxylase
MPTHATFFDQTCFPWLDGYPDDLSCLEKDMEKILWAALVHSPWDNAGQPDFWKQLREKTLQLRKNTDKALMINCGCNLFEWGTFLRRMDNFLMDLYREATNVERFLDAIMKIHMETLAKVCEAVGDIVDIIRFGDDLGMDSGPFMPLDKYRRFFHQHRTQLCDFVKKNSQMHTFLHTCGSVHLFIPDFIESGIEIINPVQTSCRDMEPDKLKNEFGNDIVFWGGGVDTRNILNRGSVADVKDQVKQRLEIFSPNGGFVFNPIHNILPDVPPENIVAMFEAIEEFNQGV